MRMNIINNKLKLQLKTKPKNIGLKIKNQLSKIMLKMKTSKKNLIQILNYRKLKLKINSYKMMRKIMKL